MAALTIELKNLTLLARRGRGVTAHFPRNGHRLAVTYRRGGRWHDIEVPAGADISLLDGGPGAVVALDPKDPYIPHADDIFGRAVRVPASALELGRSPRPVGARLWLPSGALHGMRAERYPQIAEVEWEFHSPDSVYRHRVTDSVRLTVDVPAGTHDLTIVAPDGGRTVAFDVGPSCTVLSFINRDDCDPPANEPLLELRDFEELYRLAGIDEPHPIPRAAAPPDFAPSRMLRHVRRASAAAAGATIMSCDSICGTLQVDVEYA